MNDRVAVAATVLVTAGIAATGAARPVGGGPLDHGYLALAAAIVAFGSRSAPSWFRVVGVAVVAAVVSGPVPVAMGFVALGCAIGAAVADVGPERRSLVDVLGAAAGGLGAAALSGVGEDTPGALWPVGAVALFSVAVSGVSRMTPRTRRRVARGAMLVTGALVGFGVIVALAVAEVREDADRAERAMYAAITSVRRGDILEGADQLEHAHESAASAAERSGGLWSDVGSVVPGLAQQVAVMRAGTTAAEEVAAAAVEAVRPAESIDLDVDGQALDLAAIAAAADPLDRLVAQLASARARLGDATDTWVLPALRSRVARVDSALVEAMDAVELAATGARAVPDLLGHDAPRRYLVLLTTHAEARSFTGFPGNYAVLRFDDGDFSLEEFGRSGDINERLPDSGVEFVDLDEYVEHYAEFGVAEDWRNVPISPDFPTVARAASQMYAAGGGTPVDGAMSMDTTVLAALLTFTGRIEVPDTDVELGRRTAEQFLLLDQYVDLEADSDDRVDALESVAKIALERLDRSDIPGIGDLRRVLGPLIADRHLQFVSFDGGSDFLDAVNLSGRVAPVDGDYLSISSSNASGNKLDQFVRQDVDYRVDWDPRSGGISATATITLVNDAPDGGLPDYVIGSSLPTSQPLGSTRTYVSVYTPWRLVSATLDGERVGLRSDAEVDRSVYRTMVPVGSGERGVLTLELEGSLVAGEPYHLFVQPQPSVRPGIFGVQIASPEPLDARSAVGPACVPERALLRCEPGPSTTPIEVHVAAEDPGASTPEEK